MLNPGLTSVTFKDHSPQAIIQLAAEAKLAGIEWAGDIHVKPGDIQTAQDLAQQTTDAGLSVMSYGSYYRCGLNQQTDVNQDEFKRTLDSAIALGAPRIRVWAGKQHSYEISQQDRQKVIDDLIQIAGLAEQANIQIGVEYHASTLTDTDESACELVKQINQQDAKNIKLYWQPHNGAPVHQAQKGLAQLLKQNAICAVHLFHWSVDGLEPGDAPPRFVPGEKIIRHPLLVGEQAWQTYLSQMSQMNLHADVMMEFVANDSIDQFKQDAQVLNQWIQAIHH